MSPKSKNKTAFGDFQTPLDLAKKVCNSLVDQNVKPASIVEPTCGLGSFLKAAESAFPDCPTLLGYEINPSHIEIAKADLKRSVIRYGDFFRIDWPTVIGNLSEPVLVVGNPPWVTNSVLGSIQSKNLPTKSNFQKFNGFDAITGKSNFDISEWMLIRILEWLSGRNAVVAMLCKTVVARKVLRNAWRNNVQISKSSVYSIDAKREFNAAVDACLLVCILKPGSNSKECRVFSRIENTNVESTFALRGDQMISDLDAFAKYGHLSGKSPLKWRSGVKHDCAKVMELKPTQNPGEYLNGLGDIVRLESSNLYPMLKSSELSKGSEPSRYMLVTQRSIGEDTARIAEQAPRTWQYLVSHAGILDSRNSSIYRNRPPFSVFGVGDYTFAPWKVAISGFYKGFNFKVIAPREGTPVVLDDTCYFLPCESQEGAESISELLNSKIAKGFYESFVFWDTKRPITASLLGNLDLKRLASETGVSLTSTISKQSPDLLL